MLGPSGCGKTTLLNLLSGFLPPDSGRITIDGETVTPKIPALGHVFQSPLLFPWPDVLDMCGSACGWPAGCRRRSSGTRRWRNWRWPDWIWRQAASIRCSSPDAGATSRGWGPPRCS
nr:ATP-binding cassette domain-containing protein [Azospirillum melinis]